MSDQGSAESMMRGSTVNQEHITENSVQHEKMMHIMELGEKNLGQHVAEKVSRNSLHRRQIESASGQIQEGL